MRWAAKAGHWRVVAWLLEQGADVHACDDEALRWAADESPRSECGAGLLRAGAQEREGWSEKVLYRMRCERMGEADRDAAAAELLAK